MNVAKTHRRIARTRRWIAASCLAVLLALSAPSASFASSSSDENKIEHDARLDGYSASTVLDAGGTAVIYILMGFLGVISVAIMFMKGNRSHLD